MASFFIQDNLLFASCYLEYSLAPTLCMFFPVMNSRIRVLILVLEILLSFSLGVEVERVASPLLRWKRKEEEHHFLKHLVIMLQ